VSSDHCSLRVRRNADEDQELIRRFMSTMKESTLLLFDMKNSPFQLSGSGPVFQVIQPNHYIRTMRVTLAKGGNPVLTWTPVFLQSVFYLAHAMSRDEALQKIQSPGDADENAKRQFDMMFEQIYGKSHEPNEHERTAAWKEFSRTLPYPSQPDSPKLHHKRSHPSEFMSQIGLADSRENIHSRRSHRKRSSSISSSHSSSNSSSNSSSHSSSHSSIPSSIPSTELEKKSEKKEPLYLFDIMMAARAPDGRTAAMSHEQSDAFDRFLKAYSGVDQLTYYVLWSCAGTHWDVESGIFKSPVCFYNNLGRDDFTMIGFDETLTMETGHKLVYVDIHGHTQAVLFHHQVFQHEEGSKTYHKDRNLITQRLSRYRFYRKYEEKAALNEEKKREEEKKLKSRRNATNNRDSTVVDIENIEMQNLNSKAI